MTHTPSRRIATLFLQGSALFALPLLFGCQGQKVVAKVNDKSILADDYNLQVQQVRGQTLARTSMDAGEITLIQMIEAALIDTLAADPTLHAIPSDDKVKSYVALLKRIHPELMQEIQNKATNNEELTQQIKMLLEMHAIGTDASSVSDSDITAAYNDLKSQNQLDFPGIYTVRLLPLSDPDKARQALEQLKKTRDFKSLPGISPAQAAILQQGSIYSSKQLQPELVAAFNKLASGEFTPEPVALTLPDPNNPAAPPQTSYIIAQLISKEPGKTPQIPEIHTFLEQTALERKFPQWQQHEQKLLADFTLKSKIEIFIPRYQSIVSEVIMPQAKSMEAQSSAPQDNSAPGGAGLGR